MRVVPYVGTMAGLNGAAGILGAKHPGGHGGDGFGSTTGTHNLSPGANLPPPGSSLETLLLNILGLLKVAAQNARNWEQQVSAERGTPEMIILPLQETRNDSRNIVTKVIQRVVNPH